MKLCRIMFGSFIISIFALSGCADFQNSNNITIDETQNPDAEEVLTVEPNADIFQFDGVIYQTNIDWINELTLTKGKQIGEIEAQQGDATAFKDNTANNLPVGTNFYAPNEHVDDDIILVELDGEILHYYAIVEG